LLFILALAASWVIGAGMARVADPTNGVVALSAFKASVAVRSGSRGRRRCIGETVVLRGSVEWRVCGTEELKDMPCGCGDDGEGGEGERGERDMERLSKRRTRFSATCGGFR